MATATMSLLGLYRAYPSLFQFYNIPEGMDKEILVNNILVECAELECLYPDAPFMAELIGYWSKAELPVWSRMWKAMQLEYNPIENYNRVESWSNTGEHSNENTLHSNTTATGNVTTTDTKTVSAFNSNSFENSTKNDISQNGENTGSNSATENQSGSTSETRTGKVSGNIGVTTSQRMLEAELNVAQKGNIYRFMIESFKERFCILVY